MNLLQIAESINRLGDFCGMRDIPELTPAALYEKYGFLQADVLVLFGGSILCGGDVLASAMKAGVAKKYGIVGGVGHTTKTLRENMRAQLSANLPAELSEAEMFALYLKEKYSLQPDFLECRSTNCGNNITFLLELLHQKQIPVPRMILVQDATMQRRMDAGLRKYAADGLTIVNYAAYRTRVCVKNEKLVFDNPPKGMWDVGRYASLLMGEIRRLSDDQDGYGPNGAGFIAHVDVPKKVQTAFSTLQKEDVGTVRPADDQFATKR